jgi:hypothetical protein
VSGGFKLRVDVETLRREADQRLLGIASVPCAECGEAIGEDEAQAQRWGYWSEGRGEVYPFCPRCAGRRFERVS